MPRSNMAAHHKLLIQSDYRTNNHRKLNAKHNVLRISDSLKTETTA